MFGVTARPYGQAASSRLSRVSRPAGVAQEALEQGELARAEGDRRAGHADGPVGLVEDDRAVDQVRSRRRPVGPPGKRPQPRRELLVGERLDQVVVGAGVEAANPILDRVPGGEDHDGQVGAGPAQLAQDLETRTGRAGRGRGSGRRGRPRTRAARSPLRRSGPARRRGDRRRAGAGACGRVADRPRRQGCAWRNYAAVT